MLCTEFFCISVLPFNLRFFFLKHCSLQETEDTFIRWCIKWKIVIKLMTETPNNP